MKIEYLDRNGVPPAERDIHIEIENVLNQHAFSRNWKGFASFQLIDHGQTDDFDLVLLTDKIIVCVELKKKNGKLLEASHKHWLLDGESLGYSPFLCTVRKSKKLASSIKDHIGKAPWITAIVVLHGEIQEMDLPSDEAENVFFKEDFFELMTDPVKFADHFHPNKSFFPERTFQSEDLIQYFAGSEYSDGAPIQPKPWKFGNYEKDPKPEITHPNQIYNEYLARNDAGDSALIRLWNFGNNSFPELVDEKIRKGIALREKLVWDYLRTNNSDLQRDVLQPLITASSDHIGLDYAEVLEFAVKHPKTLNKLIESRLKDSSSLEERSSIYLALLKIIRDLHELNIHHNDLDDKNIWCNDALAFRLTGFYLADVPGQTLANVPAVARLSCPSEISYGEKRDIFALGQLAKEILLAKDDLEELPEERREMYRDFIHRAELGNEFSSVNEMFEAFQDITVGKENKSLYSPSDFQQFIRPWEPWDEDYIRDGQYLISSKDLKKYCARRIDDEETVVISKWRLKGGLEELSNEQSAIVLNFLTRLDQLKAANDGHIVRILDFGIAEEESDRLFLIEETTDDLMTFSDWCDQVGCLNFEEFRAFGFSLIDAYQTYWDSNNSVVPFTREQILVKRADLADEPVLRLEYTLSLYADEVKVSLRKDNLRELCHILNSLIELVKENENALNSIRRIVSEYLSADLRSTDFSTLKQAFEPSARPLNVAWFEELRFDGSKSYQSNLRMLGDGLKGDQFTIKFLADKIKSSSCMAYLCGANDQAMVEIDAAQKTMYVRSVRKVGQASRKDAISFTCPMLKIVDDGTDNAKDELFDHPVFSAYIKNISDQAPTSYTRIDHKILPSELLIPSIKELWDKILSAEQEAIPSYKVLAFGNFQQTSDSSHKNSRLAYLELETVPYFYTRDPNEKVCVMKQKFDNGWAVFGELDRENSLSGDTQIIVRLNRQQKQITDINYVKLISLSELTSLSRKRQALRDIDSDATHIRNFSSYFEKDADIEPIDYDDNPVTPPAVVEYDENQAAAFNEVLSRGPISLLQGPPGTGKTRFISGLLVHILSTMPYARVLLTSQSNEAVNNALERTQELCSKQGIFLNAIRIGNIDKISDKISWYFSENIQKRYRQKLLVEQEVRVLRLARLVGLPKDFAKNVYRLYAKFYLRLKSMPIEADEMDQARKLNKDLNHDLKDWYNKHQLAPVLTPNIDAEANFKRVIDELARTANVTSPATVSKLTEMIKLVFELDNGLEDDHSKYTAFSTKTKSVVAGTLVGLGARQLKLEENTFDWVIVDEASRATASELAIVCRVGRRVLLVGDHKQLPPTYDEGVREELKKSLNIKSQQKLDELLISDFERIYQSCYGQKVGCSLTKQYRMDPVIGSMVSHCFYDDKLFHGRRSREAGFAEQLPVELRKSPVIWFDTSSMANKGREKKVDDDVSTSNPDEAEAIVNLLKKIFTNSENLLSCKDREKSEPMVGVICMYQGQKQAINNLFQKEPSLLENKNNIKIDTVDSYQGKENQIIIMSTVRSEAPGFLRSEKRINVAISRARDALVIFGSKRLWKKESDLPLGSVFNYITANALPVLPFDNLLSQGK